MVMGLEPTVFARLDAPESNALPLGHTTCLYQHHAAFRALQMCVRIVNQIRPKFLGKSLSPNTFCRRPLTLTARAETDFPSSCYLVVATKTS